MSNETIELNNELVQSIATLSQKALARNVMDVAIMSNDKLVPLMVTPTEVKPVPDAWLAAPLDKTSVYDLATIDSFNRLVNEHKGDSTRIYGSMSSNKFCAVIDDDDSGPAGKPKRRQHAVTLDLKPSESYKQWSSAYNVEMTQEILAGFLEERYMDIIEPDSATIIEAVEALELSRDFVFNRKIDRTSGSIRFTYNDELKENTLKLPAVFHVEFIPYAGAASVKLEVRLRYRLLGSKINFRLVVNNWDQIEQDIFNAAASAIEKGTDLVPYIRH